MIWIFVSYQNLYVEILMPDVKVLQGGAVGKFLSSENGTPMDGISTLQKRLQKDP